MVILVKPVLVDMSFIGNKYKDSQIRNHKIVYERRQDISQQQLKLPSGIRQRRHTHVAYRRTYARACRSC